MLFELERGPGAVELALQQADLVFPGQRDEVHVLQVPGVVFLADAGRPGLVGRLLFEPRDEFVGGLAGCGDRLLERSAAGLDGIERPALPADVADAGDPQVARVAGQVLARLLHQRRDDRQVGDQPLLFLWAQRKIVGPQLGHGVVRRPFVRGNVALVGPDRLVERGVARPRAQHPQVEVVAVHLRADEVPVDLQLDRPAGRVDG